MGIRQFPLDQQEDFSSQHKHFISHFKTYNPYCCQDHSPTYFQTINSKFSVPYNAQFIFCSFSCNKSPKCILWYNEPTRVFLRQYSWDKPCYLIILKFCSFNEPFQLKIIYTYTPACSSFISPSYRSLSLCWAEF
nr:unnamed protein product [Digitaria exilis]